MDLISKRFKEGYEEGNFDNIHLNRGEGFSTQGHNLVPGSITNVSEFMLCCAYWALVYRQDRTPAIKSVEASGGSSTLLKGGLHHRFRRH